MLQSDAPFLELYLKGIEPRSADGQIEDVVRNFARKQQHSELLAQVYLEGIVEGLTWKRKVQWKPKTG